jgi:subtilisin family serine protease
MWAIRLGAGSDARGFARRHGLKYIKPLGILEGFHLVRLPAAAARGFDPSRLRSLPSVQWIERQYRRMRFKRQPIDPLFENQWHLENTGQSGGTAGVDVNAVPAWNLGLSGGGVQIAVVDDGLAHTHPDLCGNYRAEDSWDFNGDDPDPAPDPSRDVHGTAAAGVAAAAANGSCGVGSAWGAGLSGIRLIAAPTTDAEEALALTYNVNHNDIYSCSWGPQDDGRRLEGPGELTRTALAAGVQEGRRGLGSIYVWAAGNGASRLDNVNYDGYANSRFTIAVGAVDHNGVKADYSEPGASMLVTAPSSGAGAGITTTDLAGGYGYNAGGDCTDQFGGTSSSAPLVAGVVSLMLEENPGLTWRDVQHILVRAAVKTDPDEDGWVQNGAGFWVNHNYGFGLVDAERAVSLASSWEGAAGAVSFDSGEIRVDAPVPADDWAADTFYVGESIQLEHVAVFFSASHSYRGDLAVVLTSPDGTESILAESRLDDNADYDGWKFTSVRHWGEGSRGVWTLAVIDEYPQEDSGTWESWRLVLNGTEQESVPLSPGIRMLLLDDGS